ncbi:hypothetical protein D3C77_446690 [compost metagenome]
MTSSSPLSTPSAMAGNVSVTRFTQRIWVARSGNGQKNRIDARMATTSPKLQAKRKVTVLRMFE